MFVGKAKCAGLSLLIYKCIVKAIFRQYERKTDQQRQKVESWAQSTEATSMSLPLKGSINVFIVGLLLHVLTFSV